MITSKKRNKIFLYSLVFLILFFVGLNTYKNYVHKDYTAKIKNTHEQCQKISDVNITKLDAQTPVYFTLSDPSKKDEGRGEMHMHMDGERSKIPSKKAWLVYGEKNIVSNRNFEIFAFDTVQKQENVKIDQKMGIITYSFEIPKSGYYNMFAKNETVKDDTLFYRVAKLELLNGKHGSKDIYNDNIKKELRIDKINIDLVRVKDKKENSFFYVVSMGDKLTFKALLDGEPLKNANITVDLNSGWSKNITTDENGTASFTLIRDYFPSWGRFNKRYKQNMLITLKYSDEKNGTANGQPYSNINYILTYPLSYYPNGNDYQSYGFGLIIGIFVLALTGIIVYIYRRNRTKPFKEIKL